MAAVCQPRPNRSRTAASACAAGSPASSGAGSRRAPASAVDQEHRELGRPPPHDDRVVPGQLAGDREPAGRQRVGEQPGERRLGHHGELRAGRQRVPTSGGEHERQRRVRSERVDAGPVPAGAAARYPGRPRRGRRAGRRRRGGAARSPPRGPRRPPPGPARSTHRPAPQSSGFPDLCRGPRPRQPPASADRKATVSPATSGRRASRVI